MRTKNIFYLLLVIVSVVSCSIDNYDAPNATLSGRVIDNSTGEMVENGGANRGTVIQIYEGTSVQPILSQSFPDGHFVNAALFTGEYKVVVVGAFRMVEDTVRIKISNYTETEIKVVPNVRLKATLLSLVGTTATVKVEYSKVHANEILDQLCVVWSTIHDPNLYTFYGGDQITESVTSQNLTTGEKIFTITGLKAGTNYYIRAAARTNASGNYYNYSKTISTQ